MTLPAPPDAPDPAPPLHTPRLAELFTGFLGLGLIGFGGVLPLAHRMLVERRRWVSAGEFTDLLSLCQFLPGGNIINLSVAIGLRFHGVAGACAALAGLITAPTLIVVALGMVYDRYQDDPQIRHLFAGLAAAGTALLIAMAVKMLRPLWRPGQGKGPAQWQWRGLCIVLLCFVAIALLRLPLLPTMLVLAPLSIALHWRRAV
ncbi:chromate transporter [Pseudoroseomonas cervicalis]|uniref:chromate transporter n=1 Tax=Teichococcus cervicalis TaxID=204525 RepID=UPI002787CD39|nr:chromate transporter [Pseudoroseomonas cervicalis]MDQ1077955.1 chromate transporter [Pseudoroseomonas cervicalis]